MHHVGPITSAKRYQEKKSELQAVTDCHAMTYTAMARSQLSAGDCWRLLACAGSGRASPSSTVTSADRSRRRACLDPSELQP